MTEYRLLRGTHRLEDGTKVEEGETVEMSEERRSDFPIEKFEEVEDGVAVGAPAPTTDEVEQTPEEDQTDETAEIAEEIGEEPHEELIEAQDSEPETEDSGAIPDDYDMLQKMAKNYDGDEVHGSMSSTRLTDFFESLSQTEVANLKEQARSEQ